MKPAPVSTGNNPREEEQGLDMQQKGAIVRLAPAAGGKSLPTVHRHHCGPTGFSLPRLASSLSNCSASGAGDRLIRRRPEKNDLTYLSSISYYENEG